jgi:stress-induced-phosphoprotein 1
LKGDKDYVDLEKAEVHKNNGNAFMKDGKFPSAI